jgi:hypothetical protein
MLSSEKGNFKLLDICHHLTAGMKALCTDLQYRGHDELRQSVGGNGQLLASGVAAIFCEYSVMPTFEGVNVLMY